MHNLLIKAGTGFLIPGIICTTVGLGVGIPLFILPSLPNYNITDSTVSLPYYQGIGWITAILSIGALFDIASIICLTAANAFYSKWKKNNPVSFDLGYRGNDVFAELKIKY